MALKLRLVTPTAVGKFKLKELLSPKELLAFYKLKSRKRRRDWLAARLAAKELLSSHLQYSHKLKVPLGQIELYPGPCFTVEQFNSLTVEQLNISIAHSHGYGLCGLAQTQEEGYIGVDIERIRPIRRAVQRRFLTCTEMKRIKQLGVESEGAVLLWALKEAAFKALHSHTVEQSYLQVMRSTEISLKRGGKAAITYKPRGGLAVGLIGGYRRHGDLFLAWALAPLP